MRLEPTTLLFLVACSSITAGEEQCPDGQVLKNGRCEDTSTGVDTGPEPDSGEPPEPEEEPCRIELEVVNPGHGAEDVYWRDPITFQLEADDPTATVTVVDSAGTEIAGEVTNEDGLIRFMPTDGLTPASENTATLDWCHGTETVPFTTSELGLPLEAAFWGQGFMMNLGEAHWVQPEGMGIVMGDLLEIVMLVAMSEFDLGIDVWSAATVEGTTEQDLCAATFDLQQSNPLLLPYFQFGPSVMQMTLYESDFEMLAFNGNGTFAPDGSYLGGIQIDFMMDIRSLNGPFADQLQEAFVGMDISDHDLFCGALELMGDGCEPCPTEEAEPYCMRIAMDGISAVSTDQSIVKVEEAHCHADCPTRDEYPECD